MKRRSFLTWVGAGWLASSFPIALAACSPDNSSDQASQSAGSKPEPAVSIKPATTRPRQDGFTIIGTVTELDDKGSIINKLLDVAIIRNPANNREVIAVNSRCTHQGCTVSWNEDAKRFACPCHGSKFNPDGSVANGPAEEPLAPFETKIEENSVLVKIS